MEAHLILKVPPLKLPPRLCLLIYFLFQLDWLASAFSHGLCSEDMNLLHTESVQ